MGGSVTPSMGASTMAGTPASIHGDCAETVMRAQLSLLTRQGNATSLQVHLQHLHPHDIADGEHVARIVYELTGEFRNVDKSVLVNADVHERSEARHIGDN